MFFRDVYVAVLLCFAIGQVQGRGESFESKLRTKLLSNYDKYSMPGNAAQDDTPPVDVFLGLNLVDITELSKFRNILIAQYWLILEWEDKRLSWNPDQYGGLDMITVPPKFLWIPDIALYNSLDKIPLLRENPDDVLAYLKHDGNITYTTPRNLMSRCKDISASKDPTCYLMFGSWTNSKNKVTMNNFRGTDNLLFEMFEESKDWKLESSSAKISEKVYPYRPGTKWSLLTFTMDFKKKYIRKRELMKREDLPAEEFEFN